MEAIKQKAIVGFLATWALVVFYVVVCGTSLVLLPVQYDLSIRDMVAVLFAEETLGTFLVSLAIALPSQGIFLTGLIIWPGQKIMLGDEVYAVSHDWQYQWLYWPELFKYRIVGPRPWITFGIDHKE